MLGSWSVDLFGIQQVQHPRAGAARRLFAAAAVVGCALAAGMQGAHAQSAAASGARWVPDSNAGSQSDAALAEAEAAYREQRDRDAFNKFAQLLTALPHDAHAWLRIGNLWQRNGEPWRAIEAYRRAVESAAISRDGSGLQRGDTEAVAQAASKAATNLAVLGIEQAHLAMQAVDRSRLPAEMQPTVESIERSLRAPGTQVREPARPVLR